MRGVITPAAVSRFGEVVEASVERLVGQCHQLYKAPPLGTLVRAGAQGTDARDAVFAIVAGVATASLDPTRRVIARGADAESEEEVYREHPQLGQLLRTDVTLTVVGHQDGGTVHHYLPPLPPRIHTFLHTCTPEEVRAFTASLDFVPLLAGTGQPSGDDVLAAALRQAATAYEDPRGFLLRAARAAAARLTGDTARLNAILRRLPLAEPGID